MATSIPLPALGIKPPTPGPDPIEQYSRLQGIRDLMQRQQLAQGQGQLQQQEIQKNQLALQDQNGLHQAMIDSGGDPDKLRAAITDPKYNITPNGAFSTIKMLNDYKQSQIALDQATRKDNIDSDSSIADRYQKIGQLPPDQQASAVNDLKGDKDFLKGLTPRGQQEIGGFQYNGPDSVTMMAHSHLTRQALDEQADKEASAAKSAAQTSEAVANTAKAGAETQNLLSGANPAMADAKYRTIQAAMQQKQPISPEDKAFVAAYEKQKTLVGTSNFNLNQGGFGAPPNIPAGATGQDALTNMDPKMAAMVKMVGEYHQKSSEITQRMPPSAKANFLSALSAAYPNYDENEFPARNKMITSYTSGPESKSINAINTAMGHVGVLNDAIDALNNGNVKVLNSIANKFGVQTGATPVTTFNTIVHRVGPELAAAYIQGGGGEGERGTTAADFDPALGPSQLKSNTAITTKLLRSKIGSLENQWNTTMKPGTPDQQFQARFITPDAKSTLDKLAPQGNGAAPGLGTAKFHYAGKNGEIFSDDGKTWYDAKGQQIGK